MTFDHAPLPGPLYWDWRCLTCGAPVGEHASWWQRWLWRRGVRRARRREVREVMAGVRPVPE